MVLFLDEKKQNDKMSSEVYNRGEFYLVKKQ